MKTVSFLSLITVLFIVCSMATLLHNDMMHEDTHKQIAIHNSCKNYRIEYFPNPHFKCLERSRVLTPEEINTEYVLDSMNEIVSYNLSTIWMSIFIVGFLICITMILIDRTSRPPNF